MLLPRAKLATRISAWKEQLVIETPMGASPEILAATAGGAVGSPRPRLCMQRAQVSEGMFSCREGS